jgi:hypothetical protein
MPCIIELMQCIIELVQCIIELVPYIIELVQCIIELVQCIIGSLGGACGAYGKGERRVGVLVGKPEGKRPLGRPRLRWEDNIKIDL